MIPYISIGLMVLIGITSFLHKSKSCYAFLCFSILCGSMAIIDNAITEPYFSYYYLLAALIDLLIIFILSNVNHPNNTVLFLQKACLCFIYINLFGWIAYELYIRPEFYNSLCAALFMAILLISINTRKKDGLGDNSIFSDNSLFFSSNYSRSFKIQSYKETQRP